MKSGLIRCRCTLNRSGDFVISCPNNDLIRFNLKECDKLSKLADSSWQLRHKSGDEFRFISENSTDNYVWYYNTNEIFVECALNTPDPDSPDLKTIVNEAMVNPYDSGNNR